MTKWIIRSIRPGDVIWAGEQAVANTLDDSAEYLLKGKVIECDGQVAGVLRGHSLFFFHDELGLTSEIVGSAEDAVERLKYLTGADA